MSDDNRSEKSYSQVFKEIKNETLDSVNNGTAIVGRTLKKMFFENDFVSPFVDISNENNKRRVEVFVENILDGDYTKEKLFDFVDNLSDDDKIFFTEMIKKAIDLNDNFQIYILSCLFKNYESNIENNVNPPFNYFEKKLYYNIGSFSEDDFIIFWGVFKIYAAKKEKHDSVNKQTYSVWGEYPKILDVDLRYENLEIIYLSLNRFVDIGALSLITRTEQSDIFGNIKMEDKMELKTTKHYEINSYADTLFSYLDIYCKSKNINCDDLLKINKTSNSLEDDWVNA